MITKEYARAYTEVIEILKYVPEEDVNKIPKEKLDFYKNNMDTEYDYKIDTTKEFESQEISDKTKAILANIFRDYWATPYQKERIEEKEKNDIKKIEEEKREKYNPDNIFKNTNQKSVDKVIKVESETEKNDNLPIEVKKESFFKKLINFLKSLIK